MAAPVSPQQVLDFWFDVPGSPAHGESRDVWFRKNPAFDAEVRERFAATHAAAARGALAAWVDTPASLLALIIVTDQFPRNMHRDTAAAFATDAQALAAARTMVAQGWDTQLPPVMRWFAYLPYEHRETAADQDLAVRLMREVAIDARFADLPVWAERHQAVIARFGRFPHRNAILGRVSTAEEVEFLRQPGSSF